VAKIEGLGGGVTDIAMLPKMQRHAETKTADPKVRRSVVTDALGIGLAIGRSERIRTSGP